MLKTMFAVCLVVLFAIPALAQEETASIQNTIGYGNLTFPNLATGQREHHSGFVNSTDFNFNRKFGLNNEMGIYGVGQGVSLISNIFGGKVMFGGSSRIVPYAVAGLGLGYFQVSSVGGTTKFATRFGGGVTVPISDSLAAKIEYSRMNFRLQTTAEAGWTSGNNVSAGIVFTISD